MARIVRHCRNPWCACRVRRYVVLCPSCRIAGSAGVVVAFLVGVLLKLAGVL